MKKDTDYPLLLSICVGTLIKDISSFNDVDDSPDRASTLCKLISSIKQREAKTAMSLRDVSDDQRESISIELANMCGINLSELTDNDLSDYQHFVELVIRTTANLSGAAAFLQHIKSE